MKRPEQIRKEILLQLYANRPLACTAERIERDAKKNGYDYSATEVGRELSFLADEELITDVQEKGSTDLRWRINAAGIRLYEQTYSA